MAYPTKLLNEGEHVVVSTRTHVKALILPGLVLVLVAAATIALSTVTDSTAAGVVAGVVAAAAVVWFTLNGLQVFTKADDLVTQITGTESGIDILQYVEFQRIISGATLIAVIDVFLLTALATIGAFLYNIVAALVGGVHVTMTDE